MTNKSKQKPLPKWQSLEDWVRSLDELVDLSSLDELDNQEPSEKDIYFD